MTPREQIEELEALAEAMAELGEAPESCGVRCERCGIEVILAWADRASIVDGMENHAAICPQPKDAA